MYDYLRQHPDLFLPERKELRYFGHDLDVRDRTNLSREEYLGYFAQAPAGARIGTAYVWYLFSRSAAREISEPMVRAYACKACHDPQSVGDAPGAAR